MNLASLILSAVPVFGVLGDADGTRADAVRFPSAGQPPEVLFRLEHARGWLPLAHFADDGARALVTRTPPGSRHGADAELWLHTAGRAPVRLAAAVPPRQTGLFAGEGIVFVRRHRDQLELVSSQGDRREVLHRERCDLLWPLFVRGREVILLRVGHGTSQLMAVGSPGAARVLRDFRGDVTRDFSYTSRGIHYVSQRGPRRFEIETLTWKGAVEREMTSELPWLAPRAGELGMLVSLSPDATSGQLGWIPRAVLDGPALRPTLELEAAPDPSAASAATGGVKAPPSSPQIIAGLPAGAPIPEALKGEHAVVRVQSASRQRWFVVPLSGGPPVELRTAGRHLVSATLGAR